ncbi:MAG: c-type cytochrome [Burkholderiaceae bacterium]
MARTLAALLAATFAGVAVASNGDSGKQLFTKDATPPCALCHTLADAGANAQVGPSLDELKPDVARVVKAVREGIGAMPPYKQLSDEQVQTLARYVARASGGVK